MYFNDKYLSIYLNIYIDVVLDVRAGGKDSRIPVLNPGIGLTIFKSRHRVNNI